MSNTCRVSVRLPEHFSCGQVSRACILTIWIEPRERLAESVPKEGGSFRLTFITISLFLPSPPPCAAHMYVPYPTWCAFTSFMIRSTAGLPPIPPPFSVSSPSTLCPAAVTRELGRASIGSAGCRCACMLAPRNALRLCIAQLQKPPTSLSMLLLPTLSRTGRTGEQRQIRRYMACWKPPRQSLSVLISFMCGYVGKRFLLSEYELDLTSGVRISLRRQRTTCSVSFHQNKLSFFLFFPY